MTDTLLARTSLQNRHDRSLTVSKHSGQPRSEGPVEKALLLARGGATAVKHGALRLLPPELRLQIESGSKDGSKSFLPSDIEASVLT